MSTTSSEGISRRKRHIVVSGNNAQEMQFLSLLLQRFGYDVAVANTSAHARELVLQKRPALVITDMVSRVPGNTDLFRLLKEDRLTSSIPVVVMVPVSDAASESRYLGMGAAACITKPIQVEELYQIVQEILEPRPRGSLRIDTQLDVRVNDAPLDCGGPCSVDISAYGMYLPTSSPYPLNRRITLRLHIKERTLSLKGSVLFSHVAREGSRKLSGMGLKFVDIAPADQDFIRGYIREEITRGITASPEISRY
jgi:CheY-like chemotaxis protein